LTLHVSETVREKLGYRHGVNIKEIYECFNNRLKGLLEDTREKNKTNPPTMWFIANTDSDRMLKIVFIEMNDGSMVLKTAYEPNEKEVTIYERYA